MADSACKLCNDFGFVYLVDEDPDHPNEVIKARRDCWECAPSETVAETIH